MSGDDEVDEDGMRFVVAGTVEDILRRPRLEEAFENMGEDDYEDGASSEYRGRRDGRGGEWGT